MLKQRDSDLKGVSSPTSPPSLQWCLDLWRQQPRWWIRRVWTMQTRFPRRPSRGPCLTVCHLPAPLQLRPWVTGVCSGSMGVVHLSPHIPYCLISWLSWWGTFNPANQDFTMFLWHHGKVEFHAFIQYPCNAIIYLFKLPTGSKCSFRVYSLQYFIHTRAKFLARNASKFQTSISLRLVSLLIS